MDRVLARCPQCTAEALLDDRNLRLLTPADPGRFDALLATIDDDGDRRGITAAAAGSV